jgi:hypothetical protein
MVFHDHLCLFFIPCFFLHYPELAKTAGSQLREIPDKYEERRVVIGTTG